MTTTRDFRDSDRRCPLDGKLLEIKPELTESGAEIHACMNCNYAEDVDQAGYVTELDPAPIAYPSEPCKRCGAALVWCSTVAGRRIPVDAVPSARGSWTLHTVAGRVQAQYDFGHRTRRLYTLHQLTCKRVAS